MEKPDPFIHINDVGDRTVLRIGEFNLPFMLIGHALLITLVVEVIYGFWGLIVSGGDWSSFIPLLWTGGIVIALILLLLVIMYIGYLVETTVDVNRKNRE